jgi:FADH2 O2-dependent halogenase
MVNDYDVIVLGGAFSGSSTALVLSRVGFKVLVADNGTHPRFSIGESMVPTTSLGFRYLARAYNIPEFRRIFHYTGLTSIGCAGFPKQHFFYGLHKPGEALKPADQLMFETLELPSGPDVHMLRSEVDTYLASQLPAYGIDYLDNTTLEEFKPDDRGVWVRLSNGESSRDVRAKLVVDASGAKSYLAQHYKLRDEVPRLRTNTRGIFSHFENVRRLEEIFERPNPAFRYSRDAGTVHHCFKGGWIWVIPFTNGVTSVGVVLDRDAFPLDGNFPPEEEFYSIVNRFPTVKAQLGDMKCLRPFISSRRIQFSSRSILGDGFILEPTSATFIDPLFSSGFALQQAFITRFVPIARRVLNAPNYSPFTSMSEFRSLEECFLSEIELIDRLVSGTIESFRDFDVFKQYWRVWVYASLIQWFTRAGGRPERSDGSGLIFGAGIPSWQQVVLEMDDTLYHDDGSDAEVAARLKAIMDTQVQPHPERYTNYEIGSDRAGLCPNGVIDMRWLRYLYSWPDVKNDVSYLRLILQLLRQIAGKIALAIHYRLSRWRGTRYHKDIDYIRGQLINVHR